MRAVQIFTKEYLEECRRLSPIDILRFIEDFRELHAASVVSLPSKSRLISMKVPENLLRAFQAKSSLHGTKYQTQIKTLMQNWLMQKT